MHVRPGKTCLAVIGNPTAEAVAMEQEKRNSCILINEVHIILVCE